MMLKQLEEFRKSLDDVMHRCMQKRIVIYGYGYSGRFVAWYASYYHSINVDYIITLDMSDSSVYEYPLYRESLFSFNYKDVKDAIVWLCTTETPEIQRLLEQKGYRKNETYFDMNEVLYGKDYSKEKADTNVQFFRFLEKKYGCDLVERIKLDEYVNKTDNMCSCRNSSPKELFPLLDRIHIKPTQKDAIFDFGCGKGAALVSFLDYGFTRVGGVEYADNVFDIAKRNLEIINRDNKFESELIHGDAREVKEELDKYNYFYFYHPFGKEVDEVVLDNICESIARLPRKVYIIYILPFSNQYIKSKNIFTLTNQIDIQTCQRCVDVYVTK